MKTSLIIISNGKRPEFLKQALESAENQTYNDLEIILSESNGSSGVNMQNGINKASGELICYLCDDDLLTPDSIEKRVKGMKDFDFIHSRGTRFYENGTKKQYGLTEPGATKETLIENNGICGGSTMYRADLLKELGWNDYWTSCEFLNHMRYLLSGKKLGFVDVNSYLLRQHSGQKSIGNLSQEYQAKRKEYRTKELKKILNDPSYS